MRDPTRVLVVALVAVVTLAVAVGVVLWSGAKEPDSDPPTETVQLFPPAEQWAGVRWSRIEQAVLNVPGASLQGVSSHGSWIVAWGETPVPDPAAEGGATSVAVVWTSRGGLAWEQHELRLVTGERLLPQNLAVGPAGYLAYAFRGPGDRSGLVAVSKDAEHWVEAGRLPFDAEGLLAATATGFVAVGLRAGEPTVLTTTDGAAWEQVTVPARDGLFELSDVRRTTDGFLVAGRVQRARDWEGVLWRSGPGGRDDLGANSVFSSPDRGVAVVRTVPFAGGIFAMGSA
ncbi:MAG: hypothetical protein M3R57_04710, partial [Chloroflexota bacterium]|nr:hypothetical protein [Chloroflexota bacterium]